MEKFVVAFSPRICCEENCSCFQHQFMNCIKNGHNQEAKSILQQLEHFGELIDTSGSTLLHFTVKFGNAEMTEHLITRGFDVNAYNHYRVTPLMLAVKAKDLKITVTLLKNNADIYVSDGDGMSSLEWAFYMRFHTPPLVPLKQDSHVILEMFFDIVNDDFSKGRLTQFLLNSHDLMKFTIVVFGNVEITNFMLENGYSIDYQEPKENYTALHCAIRLGRSKNAKILIERGANVDAVNDYGWSPLSCYVFNFENLDENAQILKSLLRLSTTLSLPKGNGRTDVEYLLLLGKKKTVKTVLLSGIDVNKSINKNESLWFLLISNKDVEVLDLFAELNIKFDVNRRTVHGYTALMAAAVAGCPKKIKFLLQHGADVNLIDNLGNPALSHIEICNSTGNPVEESKVANIIELLLQHGADARTFYSDRPYLLNLPICLPTKVIIAHLTMLAAVEKSPLTDSISNIIKSKPELMNYFDLCTKQLEDMNNFKVNRTITMFKLLSEKETSCVGYARNQELITTWSSAMDNSSHLEFYYSNTLRRRLTKVLDEAKLQVEAALAIEALTGLCSDVYNAIVYQIIGYLNRQDLHNLYDIERIAQ